MHGMTWTGDVAAILLASLLGSVTWVSGATADDAGVAAGNDAGAAMALRGDTVPASPQWTLEEALVRSLEVAPRIGQWRANREAAEAGADWLGSPYLPTISAGASLSRSRFPTTVTPIREPGTFPPLSDEIREASISVAWTVFDFGRGREGRLAARTLAEAAGSREEQARMETLETVTDHFIQLAALEGVRMAEQSRLASIRETEAQVRALVDEGRLPRVDQLRLTELLLEAQADLRSTEEDLRRLAGSLSTELSLEAPLLPDAVRVPELRTDLLPPPLLPLQNPRGPLVGAAEARLEAADHEARESRRALFPELQLIGQQRLRSAPDIATDRDWLAGVQVRIPLFQGQSISGIRIRDAQVRERTAELAGARASLEAAVRDLLALERDARDRLGVLAARIGHLEEAYRIEVASYREGRTTLADLLATEARLSGARAERIGLMGTLLLAHARTASLTGELSISMARDLLGDER